MLTVESSSTRSSARTAAGGLRQMKDRNSAIAIKKYLPVKDVMVNFITLDVTFEF